jgi:hypothetical protein
MLSQRKRHAILRLRAHEPIHTLAPNKCFQYKIETVHAQGKASVDGNVGMLKKRFISMLLSPPFDVEESILVKQNGWF